MEDQVLQYIKEYEKGITLQKIFQDPTTPQPGSSSHPGIKQEPMNYARGQPYCPISNFKRPQKDERNVESTPIRGRNNCRHSGQWGRYCRPGLNQKRSNLHSTSQQRRVHHTTLEDADSDSEVAISETVL